MPIGTQKPQIGSQIGQIGSQRPDRYSNNNGNPMAFNSKPHLLPCMKTNSYVIFNIFKDEIHILTRSKLKNNKK
jgi:hypothetical protein